MSLFCLLFWHRWRPQAVEPRTIFEGTIRREDERPSGRETIVLYRCERCPSHKVKKLDGEWTLEQLVLGEEMADSPGSRTAA